MKFDLSLARASLALDVVSHTLVAIAPTEAQSMFVAFSVVSSLSAGAHPTLQSLALGFASTSSDMAVRNAGAGAIFGAMSAILSAGQMIAGPLLFGGLYARTVAVFPKAVFVFAAAAVFVALLLLSSLEAPKPAGRRRAGLEADERGRGRSRTPKDLRSPGLLGPRRSFGAESALSEGEDFGSGSSGNGPQETV
jgi:MFS family permease